VGKTTTGPAGPSPPAAGASSRRWGVLGAFMLVSIVAQMLWITFSAPLTDCSVATFCPSSSSAGFFAELLAATYPLAYVLISLPVGAFVDTRGFRTAVLWGAGLLAVSGVLRPFAPDFDALLIFQGIGALGQPFVLNSISKLVRSWFPEAEHATATGVATLSIYIGLAMGLGLTPFVDSLVGVVTMLEIYGAVAVLALVVFVVLGQERSGVVAPDRPPKLSEVLGTLRIRNIALLSALFFIGIGIFNSIASNIGPMLEARAVPSGQVGTLGGVLIVGGIFGALVMSIVADRWKTLLKPLLLALPLAALGWFALGLLSGVTEEAVGLFILGFFFMSTLPLALDLSARSVPGSAEGAANAVVWEFSQIGGFVLIFVFGVLGAAEGFTSTFYLSAVLTLAMLAIGLFLRDPAAAPRKPAGALAPGT
jgi:predicted MFS family arabinose efflux permease